MSTATDVVIIGAGLSGLQAAIDLCSAGYSVKILEARDRIGGKLWSAQRADGKGVQELGAAWLNDTNQSLVWEHCKQLGLTPVVQNVQGSVASEDENGQCHFFPFGELPQWTQIDQESIAVIRDAFEAASLNPETFVQPQRQALDSITFEQWCRDHGATPTALRTATVWCRGTLGQDPSDVSALAFLEIARGALGIINLRYDGKHGGQHLRLREGTQSIALGLAGKLPSGTIHLGEAVTHVEHARDGRCFATTNKGQRYAARRIIVSIPSPAYKNLSFAPSLPREHHVYSTTARYGVFVKYICLFRTPFWRDKGACGLTQSFSGPLNHCRDTSVDDDENYALTSFVTSKPARRWLRLNEQDRRKAILQQLGALFDIGYERVLEELIDTMETDWQNDPWAGWGCPFAAPPTGVIGDADDGNLCSPMYGGICLVGTELTNNWRGYMEGALRSGRAGAEKIMAAFEADAR